MNKSKIAIDRKKGNNYEKEFYYAYHPQNYESFSYDRNGHVHRMDFR